VSLPRIGWSIIDRHPAEILDAEAIEIVRLWQLWRPTGFGGFGLLPFSGGTAEQPVLILDAFAHCSRVANALREDEERAKGRARGE
jgi:hypothetical protein